MQSLEYSPATSSVSLATLKDAPVAHPISLGFAVSVYMLLNAVSASAEPVVVRDCESCPELVVIPAGGSFVMGAEDVEGLAWGMPEALAANEQPVAAITIAHSYAIGRTEVTRAQFAEFVEETGFTTMKGCSHLTDWGWQMQPEFTWRDNSIGDSDDHPAPCLRRAEILAYLDWLSARTGHAFRLPSEAEWEYAARANSKFAAFWGEDWTQACAFQNGADRSFAEVAADIPYDQFADCDDGYAFTAPVASFEPNAFGLYDVAGNVSELTADCYALGHADAPRDGTPYIEPSCRTWVIKGGSWAGFPGLLRVATRLPIFATTAGSGFGFRVARDVD
ncbi:MAG: formylglycine-generating enzyme family protein [Gammaproteobacteria bacterium]|nr:formylglycine-generating enzyme family protein [Gammaproteobacteria bacterium]MYF67339.1 formylglycine-generating enzyme family protein [Gammaproteobacteria bacterium]MYK36772.1 formylglycine-generating enzyme family protein [Gammaproteobacteria bacterium]